MIEAHRSGVLLHVLPTRAAAQEDVHADLVGVDLDLDVLINHGHHFHFGEAGVATAAGIKRADAHQAMGAFLGT